MSIHDKSDLFFHDYSIGPLFVQQNYLSVAPNVPKTDLLNTVAMAADSLSLGDLVDRRIRSNMSWSLLPTQAMFSSVLPGTYMSGRITGQINFPGWLGKNSKTTKRRRLAQEVYDHTRLQTSASVTSFRMDYAPILINKILRPLKEKGLDGVQESLDIIKIYKLLREDLESLLELALWPGQKNPFEGIESKVKAALTRAYNKEVGPYSYSVNAAIKKKRSEKIDNDLENVDNDDDYVSEDDNDNDDNPENDVLIKAKSKTTAVASKKKQEPSTSRSTASKTKAAPKKPKRQ